MGDECDGKTSMIIINNVQDSNLNYISAFPHITAA